MRSTLLLDTLKLKSWNLGSLAIPLPLELRPGLKLVPLYTGRIGNAVITSKLNQIYTVVTDFGNEMRFTESEIRGLFEWTEMQAEHEAMYEQVVGEPIDVQVELRQRFETQRELIDKQLKKLNNKPA